MAGRRAFVAGLLAVALAPRALAQPRDRAKVIGYLSGGQPPDELVRALAGEGLVEGRDFRFELRTPPNWDPQTLERAAAELVALKPDVLLAWHGNRVGALAKATRTIPIVCGGMPDPVGAGFARTLRRPGGNVTGLSFGLAESAEITLGILKKIRPALRRAGAVHPPGVPLEAQTRSMAAAARAAGLDWGLVFIAPDAQVERELAPYGSQAIFLGAFREAGLGERIQAIATRLRIAVVGNAEGGALLDYGLDHENATGRVAAIVAKILRGADPADIPFELPERPSFVFNRTTARAIGVELPPDVGLRVTRFID